MSEIEFDAWLTMGMWARRGDEWAITEFPSEEARDAYQLGYDSFYAHTGALSYHLHCLGLALWEGFPLSRLARWIAERLAD